MAIHRKGKCIHYTGTANSDCCEAGVNYKELAGPPHEGWFNRLPCHGPDYQIGGRRKPLPVSPDVKTCDKRQEPTSEQIAESDRLIKKSFGDTVTARKAIVEACGGPWKEGMPGTGGVIDCPVCGGKDSLRYSRAGINGHVHAHCKGTDCVSWME